MLLQQFPNTKNLNKGVNEAAENEIALEKMRLFFHNALSAQIMFMVLACVLVYSLGGLNPPFWSLVWCVSVILIALLRFLLAYRFSRQSIPAEEFEAWRKRGILGAATAGLAWACGGVIMMVTGEPSDRLFFALVMGGMAFASTVTLSAEPLAFKTFSIPVTLAIVITAIIDNHGSQDYLLAFIISILLFILLRSGTEYQKTLDSSIRMAMKMRLLADERDQARLEIAEASEALKESEKRQRVVLDNDPAGILLISPDLNFIYANPSVVNLLGFSHAEFLSLSLSEIIVAPDDADPATHAASLLQKCEHPELQVRHKNAQAISIEVHAVKLEDQNVLWSMTDITERKRNEAELEEYRTDLERIVDERTNQLLEAKDEAERLARIKGEFLANMTHELRTPLNGVLGFAEVGLMYATDEEKATLNFSRIVESGRLLSSIINDILDFSKLEAGKLQTDSISYRLVDTINACTTLIQKSADDKALTLQVEIDESLPQSTVGDPYRVQQVLLNILSNAVKFSNEGGIVVNASMQDKEICISVTDSGIGMSQQEQERLFDAFSQADNSSTRRYGGTGLGMAISQRLMESMCGRIEVSSTPHIGSCFKIFLPYVEKTRDEKAIPGASRLDGNHQKWLEGLRILVVEDNYNNRILLNEMLTLGGAQVILTNGGQEALDVISKQGADAFNVVLMDIHMPGINGLAATQKIHEIDPGLPIIAQTADGNSENQAAIQNAGMVAQLNKPLSSEIVNVTILRWARR